MALIVNDRVKETSTTEGTITFNLGGAATGFQTFVAGVGDTNTTYYAIFLQGSSQWEVGLGTVGDATPDTLARTTVITSSTGSKVDFDAGTKDVFCTLPASKTVFGKQEGTDFTGSLLVGHSTTGTLSAAQQNTGVGLASLDAITSGDNNTVIGYNAGTAITTGLNNVAVGSLALEDNANGHYSTAVGYNALANSTSHRNTGVGNNALTTCVSGTDNTGVGNNVLRYVTGDFNIGLGQTAGDNITSGSGNVVIGKADVSSATADDQLSISDGEDGAVVWITGDSSGTVSANGGELTTTGKAFVMGF